MRPTPPEEEEAYPGMTRERKKRRANRHKSEARGRLIILQASDRGRARGEKVPRCNKFRVTLPASRRINEDRKWSPWQKPRRNPDGSGVSGQGRVCRVRRAPEKR